MEVRDDSVRMLEGSREITKEIEVLNNLTRVITDSMNEMASGAEQINNSVQEVDNLTQKNKQSIDALMEEVKKFKVH